MSADDDDMSRTLTVRNAAEQPYFVVEQKRAISDWGDLIVYNEVTQCSTCSHRTFDNGPCKHCEDVGRYKDAMVIIATTGARMIAQGRDPDGVGAALVLIATCLEGRKRP